MRKLSGVQIEDIIVDRCKTWFDMTVDCAWTDVLENKKEVAAYIQYFKNLNDGLVYDWNKMIWIQIDTILNDMEVCIDSEDPDNGDCWEEWLQVFESLWHCIEGRLV